MSNAFVQLRHFAATIETGITSRAELCPWCGGGSTSENSFAITRTSEAEAKYICHRASCGRKGKLAVWGFRLEQVLDNSTQKGEPFTPRLHRGDTTKLGDEWITELLDLYDLRREESHRMGWCEELGSGNLVVPVCSPRGIQRGVEVRRSKVQVPHVSSPKTEPYRVLDEPWMGWYRAVASGPVIFVEDAISALKVSRHFQVACLHGSHLTQDMLIEALTVAGVKGDLIIALDRDATGKALKFVAQNRFIAPNFRCVPLSKDLKYSTDIEIQEILRA